MTTFFLLVFSKTNKVLAFLPYNQAKMAMGMHNLIYHDFSTIDARWIGNNTDILMIQSPFSQLYKNRVTKLASEAKNANPNLKIYLYKNWMRSGTPGKNQESSVNILGLVPQSDYPKYFKFIGSDGQPVTGGKCEYNMTVEDTKYCMKFFLPDWQDYFIRKSIKETDEYGTVTVGARQLPAVDGVFIDELKNRNDDHLVKFSSSPSGGKFLVNAGDDCKMLFSTGCSESEINSEYCGFCPETSGATAGIMDETFMTNWDYASDKCHNPYMSPQVVRNQLWQAQEAVKQNKLHWLVLRTGPYNADPGCVSHRQLLSYTFAGYLLVADGSNVYFYSKANYSSGDLIHYQNELSTNNPDKDLYNIPLGLADGDYQEINTSSGYYFKRSFSGGKGLVIVNPNTDPVANIGLPPGKVFRDQDGSDFQNTINLDPHQGIILLDKNNSPGPIPTSIPTPVPTISGSTPGSTIPPITLSPQVTASVSGEPLITFMGFSFNPLLIAAMSTILVVVGMILL